TAKQDSSPMLLLVGQVPRPHLGREAFQEIDYRQMFGTIAKWVTQIDDPDRIPEIISRAFHTSVSGRPGPVVVALPEDVLTATCASPDVPAYSVVEPSISTDTLTEFRDLLAGAQRPLVLIGGGGWNAKGCADVVRFAEQNNLPVTAAFRFQDHFDNTHRCYAGDAGVGMHASLANRIKNADLLIVVGARLGEITTEGYALLDVPKTRQKLVHIHPSANELGKVYYPDLAIHCGSNQFAAAARSVSSVDATNWTKWTTAARDDYLNALNCPPQPGELDMGQVTRIVQEKLSGDAIITNGAGNFTAWPNKFYQFRELGTLLAPQSGAMGYGVPAAIAAKLVYPERKVICFSGDGDFLMNGQELATASQYGAGPVILLVNNGMYGTIRMHQELSYPGRVHATTLQNPDFVALAQAYGWYAERVTKTELFEQAFDNALNATTGALLELIVDPEGITPRQTLSEVRSE
ncbi:MAG: thiamine pyrophosphate-dependent enzyme, partial [Gammaproteobacteria bacterium]|nr:thiamine pyrophosphate-dependent enzyme [Gammaproteobacteria bacterium]